MGFYLYIDFYLLYVFNLFSGLMLLFYNEYQFLYVYFNISFCFVFFLLVALYVCAVYAPDSSKGVPYECGFLAFSDSRELFNLQFYIIALLFLIFDLEIILLLP
jgi:NADH:ubiquinone oxidoreductase subunit 3 (subunit A)